MFRPFSTGKGREQRETETARPTDRHKVSVGARAVERAAIRNWHSTVPSAIVMDGLAGRRLHNDAVNL